MRFWLFCAGRGHRTETRFGVTRCRRCRRTWRGGIRV